MEDPAIDNLDIKIELPYYDAGCSNFSNDHHEYYFCLFCDTKVFKNSNLTTESYNSVPFPGSEGNCQLNKQLWSLFILQKLLKYPQQKTVDLFKADLDGSLMNSFDLCQECQKIAKQAMKIHLKVLKLDADLRHLQNDVERKIKLSCEQNEENRNSLKTGTLFNVRTETRKHFTADAEKRQEIPEHGAETCGVESEVDYKLSFDDTARDDFFEDDYDDVEMTRIDDTASNIIKPVADKKSPKKRAVPKTKRKNAAKRESIICPICCVKMDSRNKSQFDYHVKRHEYYENCEVVDGKLKCKICDKSCSGIIELRQHTQKDHASELGIPSFPCRKCDKTFTHQHSLDHHTQAIHDKQCRFYCDVCGYGTMFQAYLNKHMQVHTTDKTFVCELCAASFKLESTLKTHITRVHSSSRESKCDKFKCKYCDGFSESSCFANKSLLDRHMKDVHSDLYVHKCDQCENSYLSQPSLQLHKKINHGAKDQQAECQFCHVKVLNKIYLYAHYQKRCKKKPPGFKYSVDKK